MPSVPCASPFLQEHREDVCETDPFLPIHGVEIFQMPTALSPPNCTVSNPAGAVILSCGIVFQSFQPQLSDGFVFQRQPQTRHSCRIIYPTDSQGGGGECHQCRVYQHPGTAPMSSGVSIVAPTTREPIRYVDGNVN